MLNQSKHTKNFIEVNIGTKTVYELHSLKKQTKQRRN